MHGYTKAMKLIIFYYCITLNAFQLKDIVVNAYHFNLEHEAAIFMMITDLSLPVIGRGHFFSTFPQHTHNKAIKGINLPWTNLRQVFLIYAKVGNSVSFWNLKHIQISKKIVLSKLGSSSEYFI